MRHCKKRGRLGRRTSWRKATLKCLANDLIRYQRIETTLTKAKTLRVFVEPLITMAKKSPDSVTARRRAFSKLCDKSTVKTLFDTIAPLYKEVNGGYTRVMALGTRRGDGASMAIIEFTKRSIPDEDLLGKTKTETKSKTKAKSKATEDKSGEKGTKDSAKPEKKAHVAPEVPVEEKEKRAVEDVRKEKARSEQKKLSEKGLFKRFRRKSV
ncbi:MAG: 50S ribosomal protein L17 [Candidatus Omnitrophica bacterium]|nr:50S ribosomal protein L17 [Candidatus Omnitrophota bacterium]MDD5487370.1 50S ribosomal protein L17 [Candidatus Omnitrophota bacterium]